MTAVSKSDAQLNAEAEAPQPDLANRIALHRLMFRKDNGLPLKLHQRDGDDAGLGAPFSGLFAAYLDGSGHTDSWNAALLWMRERVCRTSHSKHWAPEEFGGSLCYKLVSHVIRFEDGIPETMGLLELTEFELTCRTLDSALTAIERRLEWVLRGEMPEVRREPAEWMAPVHAHVALDGLHRAECPQCLRRAA